MPCSILLKVSNVRCSKIMQCPFLHVKKEPTISKEKTLLSINNDFFVETSKIQVWGNAKERANITKSKKNNRKYVLDIKVNFLAATNVFFLKTHKLSSP